MAGFIASLVCQSAMATLSIQSLYGDGAALPTCEELLRGHSRIHTSRDLRLAQALQTPIPIKNASLAVIPVLTPVAPADNNLAADPVTIRLTNLASGKVISMANQQPLTAAFVGNFPAGDYCLEVLRTRDEKLSPWAPSRIFRLSKKSQLLRVHLPLQAGAFFRIGDDWLPVQKSFHSATLDLLKPTESIALFSGPRSPTIKNRVVLEATPTKGKAAIEALIKEFGGHLLGMIDDTKWYVAFPEVPIRSTFLFLDERLAKGELLSWDSEQYYEIEADSSPNDPQYHFQNPGVPPGSGHHQRQGVDSAWRALESMTRANRSCGIGCADVTVASVDLGGLALENETEAQCNAADGTAMMRCFDSELGADCGNAGHLVASDPAFRTNKWHHTGSFGIIAACHNNTQVAGIAPGTHHLAINLPRSLPLNEQKVVIGSVRHMSILKWLAGAQPPCLTGSSAMDITDPCRWPVLHNPPQVANHPYNPVNLLALEEHQKQTFEWLATKARNGLGVVTVFSAGNAGKRVEDGPPMPASLHTLSVANCHYREDSNDEALGPNSNFGFHVDVCALGQNAPTIQAYCTEGPRTPCPYDGTSSAASAVSGIVALMLSANPCLRTCDVRDILRRTASRHSVLDSTGDCAWHGDRSYCYGSGRVNAATAVEAAKQAAVEMLSPDGTCSSAPEPCDFDDVYPYFAIPGKPVPPCRAQNVPNDANRNF